MQDTIARRELLAMTGAVVAARAFGAPAEAETRKAYKIVGIGCSPRKGKTTTEALKICLAAAQEQVKGIETELIELADMSIPAYIAAGVPLKEGERDDFPALQAKLSDDTIIGIIVGSPVYFGTMSALCKAFLDRCMAFRADGFRWQNKVVGALAVGSSRNGGQELTVQSIKTALLGQDVIAVGTGQPSVRIGATLWNQDDSIADDSFGIGTAKDLGRHVAQVAMKMWA
ncbi:MAG: flavodoxin family protein [Candidatus Hydrogenedentes bacterium]|nr:flavodoxin family protein [Candidatus Hydrogenedentota bacterium]